MDILNENISLADFTDVLTKNSIAFGQMLKDSASNLKVIHKQMKAEYLERWTKGGRNIYTYAENAGFTLSGSASPSKLAGILNKKLQLQMKRFPIYGQAVKNGDFAAAVKSKFEWSAFYDVINMWTELDDLLDTWYGKLDDATKKAFDEGWHRGMDAPRTSAADNLDHYTESWPDMPNLVDLTPLKM